MNEARLMRCEECGGKLRVVDARRLERECVRCGCKEVRSPAPPAGGSAAVR
jgi:hypothetical protein